MDNIETYVPGIRHRGTRCCRDAWNERDPHDRKASTHVHVQNAWLINVEGKAQRQQ